MLPYAYYGDCDRKVQNNVSKPDASYTKQQQQQIAENIHFKINGQLITILNFNENSKQNYIRNETY